HETQINGQKVSEDLMEPGWTAYRKRLLYATYDVTDRLALGDNVIAATVGEGWWARDTRNAGYTLLYGERTALLAQLEIDFTDGNRCVVVTDETWRAGTGALGSASIFDGVEVDLRCDPIGWNRPGFDDRHWKAVVTTELPVGLEMRSAPPVRMVQS